RVVARPAEERVAREVASGEAGLGERARSTEAPQILDGAPARERERRALLPDAPERVRAHVAAGVGARRQRRAALDGAVRLDAHDVASSLAAAPVLLAARQRRAQARLVAAEVADV